MRETKYYCNGCCINKGRHLPVRLDKSRTLEIPQRYAMNLCKWHVPTSRCSTKTRLLAPRPQLSHDNYRTIDLFQTNTSRAHHCRLSHSINQSSLFVYEFQLFVRVNSGWPFGHLLCVDWCFSFCRKQGRTKWQRSGVLNAFSKVRNETASLLKKKKKKKFWEELIVCFPLMKHINIEWWEGFRKYTSEMDSDVMTYISSFIKIASGIQKLIKGTHRQQVVLIGLLFFFKIRKVC
jgi:hypothetical protein